MNVWCPICDSWIHGVYCEFCMPKEEVMERCAVCLIRVNEWEMKGGKITYVNNLPVHNSCLKDWFLRHGSSWTIDEIAKKLKA